MASPFETLSKKFAQNAKGRFGKGTIYRQDIDSVDDFGDPQVGTANTYAFQGVKGNYSALYAAQAGIPDTDVQIVIFNGLTKIPLPILQTDWIFMGPPDGSAPAQWHKIRRITGVDPAGATTTVQAYVTNDDPTQSV